MPATIITRFISGFSRSGTSGRWPLWEPEENAGLPLVGNPTAAVFYPGKLVFAVLPYAWGARVYVVGHTVLAFVAMLVLMRSWGTSWVGSALSALGYTMGAPILFQYCNVIYLVGAAWLPLGMHAVDRWVRSGRRSGSGGAGDRAGDAGAGGRPTIRLSFGTGRRRVCGGTGLEPCSSESSGPGAGGRQAALRSPLVVVRPGDGGPGHRLVRRDRSCWPCGCPSCENLTPTLRLRRSTGCSGCRRW